MSSAALRASARAMATAPAWTAIAPYRDTVNLAPPPGSLPDPWTSLAFETISTEPIAIGLDCERETGLITVAVFAQSGEGDATAIAAADSLRPLVRSHAWPPGVIIRNVSQPVTAVDASSGEWFRADIDVEYEADT